MEIKFKEDVYPMELRITLELPETVHNKYEEMKRHRKLTNHMQDMVDTHEGRQESKGLDSEDKARLERVEDGFLNMSNMVKKLVDRDEKRDEWMERVVDRLDDRDKQIDDRFKKMEEKMEQWSNGSGEERKEVVVQKDTESVEEEKVEEVKQEEDVQEDVVDDVKKESPEEEIERLKRQLAEKEGAVEEEKPVRKAPSGKTSKALTSMFEGI